MRLKKSILSICVAATMAFGAMAMAACSNGAADKSEEDVLREAVVAELDSIKNMDQAFLDLLAADSGAEEFAVYGVDLTEFMKKYLNGFDYSIDAIELNEDGKSALVTVTMKCKSFSGYMTQVQTDSTEWALSIDEDTAASMTEDDINAAVGAILMDALDKVEVVSTDPVAVVYEKSGDTWAASAESESDIAEALLNN